MCPAGAGRTEAGPAPAGPLCHPGEVSGTAGQCTRAAPDMSEEERT